MHVQCGADRFWKVMKKALSGSSTGGSNAQPGKEARTCGVLLYVRNDCVCVHITAVAISVAEAELGTAFYNGKKGKIIRGTLCEMEYDQNLTTIFVDNNTASGICNNTIKRQQSRAFNSKYFWLID